MGQWVKSLGFFHHSAGAAGARGRHPKATAGEPEAAEPGEREGMAISKSVRRSWRSDRLDMSSKSQGHEAYFAFRKYTDSWNTCAVVARQRDSIHLNFTATSSHQLSQTDPTPNMEVS